MPWFLSSRNVWHHWTPGKRRCACGSVRPPADYDPNGRARHGIRHTPPDPDAHVGQLCAKRAGFVRRTGATRLRRLKRTRAEMLRELERINAELGDEPLAAPTGMELVKWEPEPKRWGR